MKLNDLFEALVGRNRISASKGSWIQVWPVSSELGWLKKEQPHYYQKYKNEVRKLVYTWGTDLYSIRTTPVVCPRKPVGTPADVNVVLFTPHDYEQTHISNFEAVQTDDGQMWIAYEDFQKNESDRRY